MSNNDKDYLKLRKPKLPKIEFSKIVIMMVMITYFAGIYIGYEIMFNILRELPEYIVQALIAYFSYIGAPVSVAIAFYSWKAKNENVVKLNGLYNNDDVS